MKQRNAFPPNYIHSLDAAHMMLTALHCQKAGICFASIHDCFWTHAATVETMNRICREQFLVLHTLPLLETLREQLISQVNSKSKQQQKGDIGIKPLPPKGTFDIHEVLNSTYFFS